MKYKSNDRELDYITIMENKEAASIFKHFKGNTYNIICIAMNTETNEDMVIYQSTKDQSKIFARPLEMFFSKVDKSKYPNLEQEYRLELIK